MFTHPPLIDNKRSGETPDPALEAMGAIGTVSHRFGPGQCVGAPQERGVLQL
jgi:hypothetical protein